MSPLPESGGATSPLPETGVATSPLPETGGATSPLPKNAPAPGGATSPLPASDTRHATCTISSLAAPPPCVAATGLCAIH